MKPLEEPRRHSCCADRPRQSHRKAAPLVALLLLPALCSASTASEDSASLENQIVRATGGSKVYIIKNGTKHWISNPDWIPRNAYKWEDLRTIPADQLEAIPSGPDILSASTGEQLPSLENMLVHASGDSKVFLVKEGKRHWILDPRWVAANGYNWRDLKTIPQLQLQAIAVGGVITFTPLLTKVLICIFTVCGFLFLFVAAAREKRVAEVLYRLTRIFRLQRRNPEDSAGQQCLYLRSFVFLAFICLIILRAPYLLVHPRFWAEEGTTWFQYAIGHTFLSTLLYVFPSSGYFILLPNLAAIGSAATARLAGLEYAPLITTGVALIVQTAVLAILLFGKSRLFDSFWKRLAGCFIVLFSPTAVDEIWLNTINSMSYLGLITLLLVFEDTSSQSAWTKWVVRGLLALGGLSGPYSVIFVPLFVCVYFVYRERERLVHCVVLGACLLIQTGTVIVEKAAGGLPGRGAELALDSSLVNVLFFHVAVPTLGYNGAQGFLGFFGLTDAWMTASTAPRAPSSSLVLAGWFSAAVLVAVFLWLRGRGVNSNKVILMSAFAIFAVVTCVGSLKSIPQGRYAFLPGVLFLFLVLSNIEYQKNRHTSVICMILIALGLANGLATYRVFRDPRAPSWSQEVTQWRSKPGYPLRVWPAFWTSTINCRSLAPDSATAISGPTSLSVSPSGKGWSANFRMLYADPSGFKNLTRTHLLVNSGVVGPGSCWTYYQPADNSLWLVNDAQTGSLGPLTPGTSGTVENGQCTLRAAGSSVVGSGNKITVVVQLSFKAGFAGPKNLYLIAENGLTMGNWQPMGTWTVR